MKGNFYTLGYAGILGSVCAILLTAAASFTAPYKAANADAEKKRNILRVLQVPFSAKASSKELLKIFEDNVKAQDSNELEIYRYSRPAGSVTSETVAVAFEGPGLWGAIKGFLALETDMKTIRGITFYEQEETPGLGGEIASEWFRRQFVGKSIVGEDGKAGIIIGGGGTAQNQVDGITGATMTCDKVEAMLSEVAKRILQEQM